MRILLNELKKLLSWKILLLLVVLNSICFFLFIEFYVTHFPNGRPELDSYHISIEMLDKYGLELDEEEIEDFNRTYEEQVKEAEAYLQSREELVDLGIVTYEAFRDSEQEDEGFSGELKWSVYEGEAGDLFWGLQAREYLLSWFESGEESLEGWIENETAQQRQRLDELKETGPFKGFSSETFENFKEFILNVAIAVTLSVVLVITPIFIKDRSRRIVDLQYSTKKGRDLYKTKIAASLIAAFIVISALLAIYLSMYSLNKTSMFFDVPVNSFIAGPTWYDLTFFQYIVLSVLGVYGIGFIFALLSMSFSSLMPNYVSLIGVQIPFIIGIITYGFHKMIRNIISLGHAQWEVPALYIGIVTLGALFAIILWKREKKRDLLH